MYESVRRDGWVSRSLRLWTLKGVREVDDNKSQALIMGYRDEAQTYSTIPKFQGPKRRVAGREGDEVG